MSNLVFLILSLIFVHYPDLQCQPATAIEHLETNVTFVDRLQLPAAQCHGDLAWLHYSVGNIQAARQAANLHLQTGYINMCYCG